MTDLYRPKEAREILGISDSTLRRWCADFADWLSPTARQAITETGGVAQRLFSEADLDFLARVKHAFDDRQSAREIVQRLEAGETLPPPPPRRADPEPPMSGSAGPWRPAGGVPDVVVPDNNAVGLPLTSHPAYLLLEDLREALADQEAQQARRHAELIARQEDLIAATREQTAAQLAVAAALTERTPEPALPAWARLKRWLVGS